MSLKCSIALLLASLLSAQTTYRYTALASATVTASSTTMLTIQQPSSGAKLVTFESATAQCPGQSFTVDQYVVAAAATTTAGTAVNAGGPNVFQPPAAATVFTASNASAGTAVSPTLTYTSGAIAVVSISKLQMGATGTTSNYSVKITNTGSSSCAASISVIWTEM